MLLAAWSGPVIAASTSSSKKDAVMSEQRCANDQLARSTCMIRIILDDLHASFPGVDEGGISQIKAVTSTSYIVSLPREERIQQLTYEFDVRDGVVKLKQRSESTKSF
ncbi:hypothetical protein [Sphingomonas alpina]|uniref:Uncharacterized protein n=1 Tax=Sphingomonas alpina TaxID=653931 RepID=A0A7H0LEC8_9SPHN|nr:hypothetical protein [Sphingomonas alpina]QNQ08031.1 hypothetical protein H3Z74_14730 [Sphingomonas alpina]